MNMSKYYSLPNSKPLFSKMAKLQGLGRYLLLHHNDVIKALNLAIYSFLKNLHQNTEAYQFLLSILKNGKVTRPFMFPIMTTL